MEAENKIALAKIGELTKESKKASIVGRVCDFSRIIDFQKKDGSKGRVVNVNISDGTGVIKMVLWDRQVAAVEEGNLNVGDIVQIANGIVRESAFSGSLEIVPGKYTSVNIVETDEFDIPSLEELKKKMLTPYTQRTDIKDLAPGIFEVKGTVTDVVRGRNIFFSCPMCGGKMVLEGNAMRCAEHGEIAGEPVMVFNVVLDDGTGSIRTVFFRHVAEKTLEIDPGKFASMADDEKHNLIMEKLLGEDIVVTGRVKKNENFGRTELVASDAKRINPLEESRRLADELEKELG